MSKLQYSPEEYVDLDIASYRKRFPNETAALSDRQLFDVVAATDDDQADDEWITQLTAAANEGKTLGG